MNISTCPHSISNFINHLGKLKPEFNDQPAYQRQSVWSKEDKEELIYSIFLGRLVMPIQLHIVGERQDVVDGKQRLTAISEFLQNDVMIKRSINLTHLQLGIIKAGAKLVNLSEEQLQYFRQIKLQTVEITNAGAAEIRDFFLVQNAGRGLSAAEKRNAIDSFVRDYVADSGCSHPTIVAFSKSKKRLTHHAITAQALALTYDRYHGNQININKNRLQHLYEFNAKDDFKFDVNFKPVIEKLEKTLDIIYENLAKRISTRDFRKMPSGIFITLVDLVNDGLVIDSTVADKIVVLLNELKSKEYSTDCSTRIGTTILSGSDATQSLESRKSNMLLYLRDNLNESL